MLMIQARPQDGHGRRSQRGLSIVEFMVGITVGLIILAGATTLLVNNLVGNRRLLEETRLNQDLRAAADLVARDLRRSGYWRRAERGVWYKGGPNAVTANPYSAAASAPSANEVIYAYAKDDDAALDDDTEKFGFQVLNGTLMIEVGEDNLQPLTDPGATYIVSLGVELLPQAALDLSSYCNPVGCDATLGCPSVTINSVAITITGRSARDTTVVRNVREEVRLRNDHVTGACASS